MNKFYFYIKRFLLFLVQIFNKIKIEKSDDIILVRTDRIGDFIIWLGVAKQFKSYFQGRKITLICLEMNKEIALNSGCFDKVVSMKPGLINSYKKLWGLRADILINPIYSSDAFAEDISNAICANEKISINSNSANKTQDEEKFYSKTYSRIIDTGDDMCHEIERNQRFFNLYTESNNSMVLADLSEFAKERIIDGEYFVVNLGASAEFRRWPVKNFVKVAEYIYNTSGLKCVLLGSPGEVKLAEEFESDYSYPCENYCGKTNVSQMIGAIGNAKLVVCNDTSTVHIATASGVKCFCIAPGVHYPRFVPYPKECGNMIPEVIMKKYDCFGCGNVGINTSKTILGECKSAMADGNSLLKCIKDVSVDEVITVIKGYWEVKEC